MHPHPDAIAENAALLLSSLLRNCTRLLPKFAPGSAQYSLLQNRIAALTLALRLLRDGPNTARCSRAALEAALPPLRSIQSKTQRISARHGPETPAGRRAHAILSAMSLVLPLVEQELARTKK